MKTLNQIQQQAKKSAQIAWDKDLTQSQELAFLQEVVNTNKFNKKETDLFVKSVDRFKREIILNQAV